MAEQTKDALTGVSGTCSICGVSIASATAKHCVACEFRYTVPCATCTEPTGQREPNGRPKVRLRFQYQHHKQSTHVNRCERCGGGGHDFPAQRRCAACNDARWVFVPPEEAHAPTA